MLLAGAVGRMLPTQLIGATIGFDSGWRGIVIACLIGALMPSGPMIAFPLVVVLRHAGAGIPQIVSFVAAWSVFSWHRVFAYELVLLGWQFPTIRLLSSAILPLLASAVAIALCWFTGMR